MELEIDNEQRVLKVMLNSGKYTDLKLVCGEIELSVHRGIVCAQSPFFDKACSSGFKEATEGVINLPDDSPDAMQRLVSYFYTSDYFVDESDDAINIPLTHVRMFELAAKYAVSNLKRLACNKLSTFLKKDLAFIPDIYIIEAIKVAFTEVPEGESKPLQDIFLTSDEGHDVLRRVCALPEFRDFCASHGEFAHEVLQALHTPRNIQLPRDGKATLNMRDVLKVLKEEKYKNWACASCGHVSTYHGCTIRYDTQADAFYADCLGTRQKYFHK